ncbi:MAG TPA: hypothetical protein VL524_12100 [Gemmatimonadaceae bacterium]|nr:hypothetical protein [Gemmatimonadaceae bacterium]
MSIVDRAGVHGRGWRGALRSTFLAAACVLAAGTAAAQRPGSRSATASAGQTASSRAVDARWYPWIGCWQRTTEMTPGAALTCIVPAEGASAVDLLTVVNGVVESREHLVVDARPHPLDKDGCTGSQTAAWASAGARVYIGSAYTCAGNLHGRSSTLYAILPTGEWIDARQVEAGDGRVLNITRYRDAGLPSSVPVSIRSQIAQHALAATTARASAGGSVSQSEVAEAQRAVDSVVVQAWLTARAQGYAQGYNAYANAPAPSAPPVTAVYVYEGTPPAATQPPGQYFPSTRVPMCDSSGCYSEDAYSGYNGMSYTPYPSYPSMWYGSSAFGNPYGFGYYPYAYPVVVFGTGSRVGGHGPIRGGGGGFIHMPGRPPMGPSGFHPGQGRPSGGVPGRGRP